MQNEIKLDDNNDPKVLTIGNRKFKVEEVKSGWWRAGDNERFYYVSDEGLSMSTLQDKSTCFDALHKSHNYWKTKEVAETAERFRKLTLEALACDGEWYCDTSGYVGQDAENLSFHFNTKQEAEKYAELLDEMKQIVKEHQV